MALMWKSRCALCDCWSPGYLEDGRHRSFRPTRLTNLKVFGADPSLRCTRTQESGTAFAGNIEILPVHHFAAALGLAPAYPAATRAYEDDPKLLGRQPCLEAHSSDWARGKWAPAVCHATSFSSILDFRFGSAAENLSSQQTVIIRLTVDSRGLQRVERLQEKPVHRPGRSESKAFAVFDERDVRGAVWWFKAPYVWVV
ncbi:hypothetical protein QC764_0009130 [Podospora pseudoanserina]|uniref:Heterokaryon incompatibility domain-containing protein n=1 Tax=Podospora pseudoanserina TaxID=2609844 RepID=A0ABR0IMP4_9PEZI|nr:hypothetical protein QC764_0009130 [Podospora pseudoanserina]